MQLITTHVILKSSIGVHDNLFGGEMMSYLDLAGCAFASEKAKSTKMVTKKISEIVFHSPVKVNSLLKIYGEVVRIGNTSLTIKLEARRVDVQSTTEKLVCSAEVVFVKVNDYGEPCPINLPKTETETPAPVAEVKAPEPEVKAPLVKTEVPIVGGKTITVKKDEKAAEEYDNTPAPDPYADYHEMVEKAKIAIEEEKKSRGYTTPTETRPAKRITPPQPDLSWAELKPITPQGKSTLGFSFTPKIATPFDSPYSATPDEMAKFRTAALVNDQKSDEYKVKNQLRKLERIEVTAKQVNEELEFLKRIKAEQEAKKALETPEPVEDPKAMKALAYMQKLKADRLEQEKKKEIANLDKLKTELVGSPFLTQTESATIAENLEIMKNNLQS